MCDHCGCELVTDPVHHHHDHDHDHHDAGHVVDVRQSLLSQNERLAERNRGFFAGRGVQCMNIMSSPGSGKTALIERTLQTPEMARRIAVLVGDLATDNDAQRIGAAGIPVTQITTGTACHLDAHMVHHALEKISLEGRDLLFVENVGNLVCPASFDLGEGRRIVLIAVTEGEDKPLKYPVIFQSADVVVVNKIDLAEAVGYERDRALENIRKVAPRATIMELSARTGAGFDAWLQWLDTAAGK